MSTLKTNNIEHLDASTPSIQTTIGGGTILSGVSTVSGALNVGTGTSVSSPATNTLALGTNNAERLRITGDGKFHTGNPSGLATDDFNITSTGTGGTLSLNRAQSGNASDGDLLGAVSFQSYPSGSSFTSAEAGIRAYAETGQSGSAAPSDLRFYTKPSSSGPGASPTERLRITSGGNIGINSTIPRSRLDVVGDLAISNVNNQGDIHFYQYGTTNEKALIRMDQASPTAGDLQFWTETGDTLTQRVTINSAGNLVFNQSGNGIDFSATADGSGTMTSELLDDYEEGTWTATYYGASTAGTYTHSGGSGAYTKIGDTVNLIVDIKNIVEVSAGTGLLRIGGLPFQPSNGNEAGSIILENFTFPSTVEYACLRSSTLNHLMLVGTRNSGVDIQFNVGDRDNNTSDIFGQITYKTNS